MPASPERNEKKRAALAAVGSILLWCASGVCFARGARLLGPMAYLTLMTATGVITVVLLRAPENPLPLFLALLGGFLWACYSVLLRRWRIPAEQGGTAFHFTLCALMAAAVAAFRGEWQNLPPVGAEALFWILFSGIGPVGLAYHWWEIGVKRGHVPLISTLAYFIPSGSTLLIGLLFREAMGPGLLFGAVLIAAGAWLAGRKQRSNG